MLMLTLILAAIMPRGIWCFPWSTVCQHNTLLKPETSRTADPRGRRSFFCALTEDIGYTGRQPLHHAAGPQTRKLILDQQKEEIKMFETTDMWVLLSGASLIWSTGWSIIKIARLAK